MKATLYTDASVQPCSRSGGWGMWAASDNGRIVRGGVIDPKFCTDSNHAELAAVFAGLYVLSRAWPDIHEVMVRSDNSTVVKLLGPTGPMMECLRTHPPLMELLAKIGAIVGTTKIVPVWVKGHQKVSTRPSYVNAACDRLAKQYRIEAENRKVLDGSSDRG